MLPTDAGIFFLKKAPVIDMFCVKAPRELRINTRHLLPMTVGEMYLLLWVQEHGPVVLPVIQLFAKNISMS